MSDEKYRQDIRSIAEFVDTLCFSDVLSIMRVLKERGRKFPEELKSLRPYLSELKDGDCYGGVE